MLNQNLGHARMKSTVLSRSSGQPHSFCPRFSFVGQWTLGSLWAHALRSVIRPHRGTRPCGSTVCSCLFLIRTLFNSWSILKYIICLLPPPLSILKHVFCLHSYLNWNILSWIFSCFFYPLQTSVAVQVIGTRTQTPKQHTIWRLTQALLYAETLILLVPSFFYYWIKRQNNENLFSVFLSIRRLLTSHAYYVT